jgi:hypothetical protein
MRAFPIAIFLGCLCFVAGLRAAEPAVEQFIEVPPPPPPVPIDPRDDEADDPDAGLEPQVTIIQREDSTYEEYRLNGRLYMVKVIPSIGPPYFYVDRDGDGLMETRMNDRATQIKVPQWVIFSW